MPSIVATGQSRFNWHTSTACFQSRLIATNNARANLRLRSAAVCPNGYAIVSGPTFTTLVDCDFQWVGWWPDIFTQIQATATITCNQSGQLPQFAVADYESSPEQLYAAVKSWKEHHDALTAVYGELASIKTPEKMEAYLKRTGRNDDLKAFLAAVREGKVSTIVPPSLESLLSTTLKTEGVAKNASVHARWVAKRRKSRVRSGSAGNKPHQSRRTQR